MLFNLTFDEKYWPQALRESPDFHLDNFLPQPCGGVIVTWTHKGGCTEPFKAVQGCERIHDGIYLSDLNFNHFIEQTTAFKEAPYDKDEPWFYGVADNLEQILGYAKEHGIIDSPKKYVCEVCPMRKSEQSPDGGWRWHKWGTYIGTQEPTTEYLYDEPLIDEVWTFHFFQVAYQEQYESEQAVELTDK